MTQATELHLTDCDPIFLADHGYFFVGGKYVDRDKSSVMNDDDSLDLMYQGDNNAVWYYEANGNGTFATGQEVTRFGGDFIRESVGYGDLNGDGLGDVIFQDANNDIWTSLQNSDWFA